MELNALYRTVTVMLCPQASNDADISVTTQKFKLQEAKQQYLYIITHYKHTHARTQTHTHARTRNNRLSRLGSPLTRNELGFSEEKKGGARKSTFWATQIIV